MRSPLAIIFPSGERSDRKPCTSPSAKRTATGSADGATGRHKTALTNMAAMLFLSFISDSFPSTQLAARAGPAQKEYRWGLKVSHARASPVHARLVRAHACAVDAHAQR